MEMKGRVACEMGSHELIITELLFESAFSELEPPEVASILSCMVFHQVSIHVLSLIYHYYLIVENCMTSQNFIQPCDRLYLKKAHNIGNVP